MSNIQSEITLERIRLEKRIANAKSKLYGLQQRCKHPNRVSVHGANTGNWDPDNDSYWVNHSCPECGLRWRTDK